MAASKSGFMKDALILFAITLISGVCLALSTTSPRRPSNGPPLRQTTERIKRCFPPQQNSPRWRASAEKIAALTESGELEGLGYGSVAIESVLEGKDESGAVTGHVINSLSNNSYGGAVKISVGFDADGAITGVGIREINDTPALA